MVLSINTGTQNLTTDRGYAKSVPTSGTTLYDSHLGLCATTPQECPFPSALETRPYGLLMRSSFRLLYLSSDALNNYV